MYAIRSYYEWDGYVWRRVAGNAPEMLVDIVDAKVMDKLPENALFYGFIDDKGINSYNFV